MRCSACNVRPPDDSNKGTEYEGLCFKCVPAPVVEEPEVVYKIKETWTQYINDNNCLFGSSLTEKKKRRL